MSHMKSRDSNKARRAERQASALVRKEVAAVRTATQSLLNLGKLAAKAERAKLQAKMTAVTTPEKAPVAKQEAQEAPQKASPVTSPTPRKKKAQKAS